jgi:hypothetical protein
MRIPDAVKKPIKAQIPSEKNEEDWSEEVRRVVFFTVN